MWRRPLLFLVSLGVVLCSVFFALLSQGNCAASAPLSISQVLEQIQRRYAVTDFEAEFVQHSHLEAMGMVDTAHGHVYFRPPDMMRWHYKTPDEYSIIADSHNVWIYRPMDRQVMVGEAADYFGDKKYAQFFTEPAKLLEGFSIEWGGGNLQSKDVHVLRLLPKKREPNLEEVFLFVSNSTFDILKSVIRNAFGDQTIITFSGFKFNQGLDLSLFKFKIPEGVDVIQLGGP